MKAPSPKKKTPAKAEVKENSFPVVAIGASAGGLEAMMELLKYLPADTGMAFIYVQHLSPDHKSMLTEILSKKTKMIVQEIDDMDKIKPDNIFVIPYNKGIEVTDGHIKLIPRSETSVAITIDILFSSLAAAQKERVIGIILSGSASDGTLGMKAIKQEGGLTFAQDDTAKFNSMPHSAIAAGAVDFILSPRDLALELGRLSKHPLIKTIGVKNGEEDLIENSNPDLKIILNQLHKATGVDFSAYKMNTIKRRIIRRMLLYKIKTLKEYAKLLSQKKSTHPNNSGQVGGEEIDILYQDLLINVTSFFRDTDTHKYLKETLFPKLLKRKKPRESLRIWVPACATGEEAYSIAMMLLEIQESKTTTTPVQIFATDLSEQAISKARIGLYSKQDLETVSPKRIQRFFTKADGGFRVNKAVRDMCVFAPHNVLHDPPFSRLDFISCCNLFIYFDTEAQKKAVNTFHYALNEDGFLMLGKSENISQSATLFMGFNKKYKIFARKINSGTRTLPALLPRYAQQIFSEKNIPVSVKNKTTLNISANQNGLDNAIDAVLVSEFMPASVVINHQMEIVQFRGTTDLFLTHPKGKATFNILKMARPEIAFELRNAISKVINTKHRIRKSGIELKINAEVKIISLEIVPLKIDWNEPLLLILFTELEQTEFFSSHAEDNKNSSSAKGAAKDRRIKKLEQELAAAHADALAIAQEQEAITEELQSANEEVVSSNEELQTVNEELETSKEEIESANEELTTTNQELQTRNDLLNEAYDYSEAVFATIHDPIVVLDKNLRVKSANKTFYKIFNLKEEETQGMLLYDLGNKQWNIPRVRELLEDIIPRNSHFHHFEITHTFPIIGEKTMLLNASRIIQKANHEELILLAFADVTEVRGKAMELKNKEKEILLIKIEAEQNLRKKIEDSEKRYNMMLMKSPFTFAVLKGKDLVIALANDRVKEVWGKGKNIEGKSLLEIMPELKVTPFPALLDEVLATGIPYDGIEVPSPKNLHGQLKEEYFNFVFQPYLEADQTISGITIIGNEVTEQVMAKRKVEESEQRFRSLADNAPIHVFIIEPNSEASISYWNKNWLNYTGQTMEEALGREWLGIMHPDDVVSIMDVYIPAFEKRQPYFLSGVRIKRHDGVYRWHAVKANPRYLSNGEFIGYIGVGIDIHESILFEEELIEAKESAENAVKSKQQFLSNMSHEIRTPLNSILGFTNVLLKTELGIEQKEFLQAIKTSGKSLNVLINDILDLAKVDAGKMTFEMQPFEILKSINSILHSFNLKIKEKNLELVKDFDSKIPSMLKGDSVRLNQIVLNLISNAIKFTHKGKIILSIKLLNEDEKNMTLEFTVTDTGIGIAANKIDSIFNIFEQAENGIANSYGGTGLGLAIVKQLTEAQGGSISLKSKLGIGSTFSFILPFGKTNVTAEEEIEILIPDSEIKNLRILVAEDIALNQLLIKIILSDFGFEYEIVGNGKIATEKLQTNTYDVILMDLQMPEMNGFEATEYIRKTLKLPIPIIALTADVTTADVAKCKEFGMDDYISKPIDENQLYIKILEVLKNKP
ncbi:MAG: CheR family methyltransferase [Bacteroidia bacterium]